MKINDAKLETALRKLLPSSDSKIISTLVRLIIDEIRNSSSGNLDLAPSREGIIDDRQLQEILQELAGQETIVDNTTIAFGANSQMGNVAIQDVAGRDLIKIIINFQVNESQNKMHVTMTPINDKLKTEYQQDVMAIENQAGNLEKTEEGPKEKREIVIVAIDGNHSKWQDKARNDTILFLAAEIGISTEEIRVLQAEDDDVDILIELPQSVAHHFTDERYIRRLPDHLGIRKGQIVRVNCKSAPTKVVRDKQIEIIEKDISNAQNKINRVYLGCYTTVVFWFVICSFIIYTIYRMDNTVVKAVLLPLTITSALVFVFIMLIKAWASAEKSSEKYKRTKINKIAELIVCYNRHWQKRISKEGG